MSAPDDRLPCSTAARERGDDATATVARIDAWILVEYAGTWGRNPIRDAALPPAVRAALLAALKAIPRSRLLFIRRRVDDEGRCRVYVARSTEPAAYAFVDLPSLDDVANVPFTTLLAEARFDAPLILVCTHGQHDSCCGRRGYPLYDALRRNTPLDVWQCSHVGGDRFAANAVILPWGLFYGPVEPEQSEELIRSANAGEIFLPAFRGRSTQPRAAQAADAFVRRSRNLVARDALTFEGREELEHDRILVRLRESSGNEHAITVEQYVSSESAFATCGSRAAEPIVQFRVTTADHARDLVI